MQNSSRFVVTKCNDCPISSVNHKRSPNMNTNEVKNSTTIGRSSDSNRNLLNFHNKEYNRNKRTNPDQSHHAYSNTMFTLDESESEYSTLNFGTSPHIQCSTQLPENSWDSFTTLTPEEYDDSLSSEWINIIIVFFKLFVYCLTCIANLIFPVISMATLLLMTSMIRDDHKIILCTEHFVDLPPGQTFVAKYDITSPETIGWIWSLFVVMVCPQILAFCRCLKYCWFKNYERPKLKTFIFVFITESLDTIGLVLLVVMILPNIDPTQGLKLSHSISFIPGVLIFISRLFKDADQRPKTLIYLDVICILLQLFCSIGWSVLLYHDEESSVSKYGRVWVIPFALIFLSLGFWDNYLNIKKWKQLNSFLVYLCQIKRDLNKSRYFTYALISIWKLILTFVTILTYFAIIGFIEDKDIVHKLFYDFDDAFSEHKINTSRAFTAFIDEEKLPIIYSKPFTYFYIISIQFLSTFFCYLVSKFVCKVQIQLFSFTFPLTLVSPVTIVLLNILCRIRQNYTCQLTGLFSLDHIYWYSETEIRDDLGTLTYIESVLWVLSLVSQLWITYHIWQPNSERLAKTENLFTKPEFNCVFIDQSLILNRKIILEKTQTRKLSRDELEEREKDLIRIYMCATMWHETREEMAQMLKSVFRMDIDQSARRQAKQYLNVTSDDYYECETHILFDDAFENKKSDRIVNPFVKQFIEEIGLAANSVHECQIRLNSPTLTVTPYGGQLIWKLPGQNKLYVHLKDKNLIRHKKRWSQVMYMYYLLGYRLKDQDLETRDRIAENTFILALDGDINFQSKSVRLLVDLMKKHKYLGAACGRIHPIGGGPMVWYQKFEYAIGHWLQKATEHVIGCVLCSPGCFSLFRAKALMSENVMNKYTSKASEAIQYVQYDQGEDRWLCTLLLQQGWRIEYCAASDSYTHAPEGFGEFYNQRRRWTPSTLFNIWDLLSEYRRTVQINDNISKLYILYQFALMVGTVLSPGSIFLMIVGAINTSFNLDTYISILISGLPILIFIGICFYTKDKTQIKFAIILSIIYALLMLAVIVSTIIQMVEEGLYQPTAVFFVSMCLSFFVAAVIHPTEFMCFLPMILYMLCIPSMYLLLTIYSVINLNVVSWGTREGHIPQNKDEDQKITEENKNQFLKYFDIRNLFKNKEESRLFSCVCCSQTAPEEDKEVLKEISELKNHLNEFKDILKTTEKNLNINQTMNPLFRFNSNSYPDIEENGQQFSRQNSMRNVNESVLEDVPLIHDNQNDRPFWTKDKCFETFTQQDLNDEESDFWGKFIDKYLLPLDSDPEHEEKIKLDLRELRDKIASAFGLINSLFILLVLLLQMHMDIFSFNIPYKGISIKFDVIGISLNIFFGLILLIQFLGMLCHRFNTFSLLLSVTEINLFGGQTKVENSQQVVKENAVNIVKRLQRINSNEVMNRKKTVRRIRPELKPVNSIPIHTEVTDLDQVFLKRVQSMKNNFDDNILLPESTLSRHGRHVSIKSREVRREIYKKVQRTIRKRQVISNQF